MMHEYAKIPTVFERDTQGSKKLLEGDWRDEAVEYLSELPWEWTEKIDGTNIRVYWDGHSVTLGGRTDRAQIPVRLLKRLTELFLNDAAEQLFEQLWGEKEVQLIGEGYGAGIQNGGAYTPDNDFILFDVEVGGKFLSREAVDFVARAFAIKAVPVLNTCTIAEAISFVKTKPQSTIGTALMEGLVGRPCVELYDKRGNRMIVKVKVKDFV